MIGPFEQPKSSIWPWVGAVAVAAVPAVITEVAAYLRERREKKEKAATK